MLTLYDKPQFKLKPDHVSRMYANIPNRVSITGQHQGQLGAVLLQIPAAIFPIIRFLGIEPGETVRLYLDEIGGRYYLGLYSETDSTQSWDLWAYSEKGLPNCIKRLYVNHP